MSAAESAVYVFSSRVDPCRLEVYPADDGMFAWRFLDAAGREIGRSPQPYITVRGALQSAALTCGLPHDVTHGHQGLYRRGGDLPAVVVTIDTTSGRAQL